MKPFITGQRLAFQAVINGRALQVSSVAGGLSLRPELRGPSRHWQWKVIASGRVGRKRAGIGLYFDPDLPLGRHELVGHPQIRVVYHDTPHGRGTLYHSQHLQSGVLTLLAADARRRCLQGCFEFGISAMGFQVSEGRFDLWPG
ncbi:hypothetical protein [uncultured Pseudomonas sp.]|uniref:hypothetical protein n=1 Tax=uncultured Pseudomonas sp. TaxID=114707 RepID=UPI0025DF8C8E|nr:hypothetical protein [uncultured Pseudomonas sp.]